MLRIPENWLELVGLLLALAATAWAVDWFVTRMFRAVVHKIAAKTRSTWDDRLIHRKVFTRIAHVAPGLVFYYGIGPALGVSGAEITAGGSTTAFIAGLTQRVALAFTVVTVTMSASAFLDAINDIYNESYSDANNRPIKGYLQVVGLILYIAAGVVAVSILADRSPVVFLSGLGALTAVLMLVFRDTILSLVASLQIMSNDMIRIGDWVEMPQANVDGDVIDIALHTVKIQNWDKTISTIPTHKFITESFKNWRGMSESGGRRIKRALNIDLTSIRFLTEEEIERLSRHELLREYIAAKQEDLERHAAEKAALGNDLVPIVRRLTNVGTLRAYLRSYLRQHPEIHEKMTLLVRPLTPTAQGLPLEIYCFTNDTRWESFERIQADIFDHLVATLPEFGLEAFQDPSGADVILMSDNAG